uniref:hypothetical protein n=1 Tax=Bacillus altitudinis TaxID=293387 RepID=UPI001C92EE2D
GEVAFGLWVFLDEVFGVFWCCEDGVLGYEMEMMMEWVEDICEMCMMWGGENEDMWCWLLEDVRKLMVIKK